MTKPRLLVYIRRDMKYIISENGLGIAVGLVGEDQETQETMISAENILGVNTNTDIFKGVIYFRSIKQFKKFLVLREYLNMWQLHTRKNFITGNKTVANILSLTKRAIKQARLTMESSVEYENFMRQIHQSNIWYDYAPQTHEINNEFE